MGHLPFYRWGVVPHASVLSQCQLYRTLPQFVGEGRGGGRPTIPRPPIRSAPQPAPHPTSPGSFGEVGRWCRPGGGLRGACRSASTARRRNGFAVAAHRFARCSFAVRPPRDTFPTSHGEQQIAGNGAAVADIAIDLGTANTLIEIRGEGLVVNEPSVVAVDRQTGHVRAIGLEAKRMLGRTPEGIIAVRPMRDGVIADVDMAELMLRHYLAMVLPKRLFRIKPRVVIGVPSGITEMERRAVRAGVMAAGAKEVWLISEPMAAAIGVGLPVVSPRGSMV